MSVTQDQLRVLLRFLGYGNPAGRYWFVGMEERGEGLLDELEVRADHFAEVEDLQRALEHPAFKSPFRLTWHVPTWRLMSKVVLRLEGAPEYADPLPAAKYQAEHLGREGGDTFLTELLPLPALNLNPWPYEALFPDRTAYMAAVLSERLQRLRALFASHRPAYVVCYGKGYWEYYERLWPDATFAPSGGGWIRLARVGASCIALVPFFGYDQMSNARVETLGAALVALAAAPTDSDSGSQ